MDRPLLLLDIDGVICLFGADDAPDRIELDGVSVAIAHQATEHLATLAVRFEIVWASSWGARPMTSSDRSSASRHSAI